MNFKDSFHPYAMITILFWSLAYVLTRLSLQYFSTFSLGFLRYLIASLALIVIAVLTKMKLPRRKDCTCKMKVDTHKSVGVYILMYTERGGKKWVRKV